jgi:hypothetical protein
MSAQSSPQEFKLLPEADTLPALQLSNAPVLIRYLIAFAMTAIATVVAVGLDSAVTIPNLSLVFVVPVLIAAVAFGLGPSLGSAVLGALAYNFFLTEPRFTLRVDDPANIWAIGLLFVIGAIASAVASTARRRADEATLARRQAALVQSYGRSLVTADGPEALFSRTADALEALFNVPVALMLISENAIDLTLSRGSIEPSPVDIEAARSTLTTGKAAVADVYPVRRLALRFLAGDDLRGQPRRHRPGLRPAGAPAPARHARRKPSRVFWLWRSTASICAGAIADNDSATGRACGRAGRDPLRCPARFRARLVTHNRPRRPATVLPIAPHERRTP